MAKEEASNSGNSIDRHFMCYFDDSIATLYFCTAANTPLDVSCIISHSTDASYVRERILYKERRRHCERSINANDRSTTTVMMGKEIPQTTNKYDTATTREMRYVLKSTEPASEALYPLEYT
jgi:hypothetical protein